MDGSCSKTRAISSISRRKNFGGSAKAFAEEANAKLNYYTGDIPPNHDLEHAIRISELTSTLVLLGQYKDRKEQERLDRGGLWNEPFVPAARLFLHQQLGKSLGAKTKSDAELVAELDQKLDLAFSEHNAERVRAGLDAAQARVWSDLVAGVGEPPPDFKQLFDGDGNAENPGWALVFVAFMREALKKSPKAQVAFVASRLGALRETMGALQEKADSIKDDTAALLAFAREAARTRNVAEGFIQEMAARVARDRALDFEGKKRAVRDAIEIYEERNRRRADANQFRRDRRRGAGQGEGASGQGPVRPRPRHAAQGGRGYASARRRSAARLTSRG